MVKSRAWTGLGKVGGAGLVCFLAAACSIVTAAGPVAPRSMAAAGEIEFVLAELLASNAEWQRNDREYRQLREQKALSDAQAREFAEFVAGLRHRMLADCARFRDLGGEPSAHAIDCKKAPQEAGGGAEIVSMPAFAPALTAEEKTAALDDELRKIETELDELLMGRQSELSRIKHSRSSSGSAADGGRSQGSGESGSGGEANDGERAAQSAASARSEGAGASEPPGSETAAASRSGAGDVVAQGGPASSGSSSSPRRRGGEHGGADDDVLARQLREAAESEPDPILRDKLWDEYRKYKESIR